MRIVKKINLTLVAAMVVAAGVNLAVLQTTVMPIFLKLEQAASERNEGRALEAIGALEEGLADAARLYALTLPAGTAIGSGAPFDDSLTAERMKTLGLDYAAVLDRAGRIVLDRSAGGGSALQPFEAASLALTGTPAAGDIGSSLVLAETGAVAIGFARSGEGGMTLVLGRVIDVAALNAMTKVTFRLDPVPAAANAKPALLRNETTIEARRILTDARGLPVAELVTVTTRRNVLAGQTAIWWASGLMLASMLAILVCVSIALRLIAVRRIERIRTHLASIGTSGDLEPMPEDRTADELSETIASFNAMARQLAELRNELRHTDYRHGAADQAAGLLHNIRNAVSPISAVGWDLERREDAGWRTNLSRVLDELGRDGLDPVRAARLNELLAACAREALKAGSARRGDLELLNEMLRHVEEILREQDKIAQSDRPTESVDVADALARAVRRLGSRPNLVATTDVAPGTLALGHRVVLDQILDNLVINAAQAIEASGRKAGRIALTTTKSETEAGAAIEIAVVDNGDGIPAGDLDSIFRNGFSTRSERAGGLGLHWCANAARAMGGQLRAERSGTGEGTTMRLTLPLADLEGKVAA